jgi:DNA-directed RNA polymerase specialized sigma24 family protein
MEPADFEGLCDSTYERVAKAAFLILGDRDEARDVAQETFARAFSRWTQVRAMDNPEGWLYRVAVNLSVSWRRQRWRRVVATPPDGLYQPTESNDPALTRALRRLTPSQAQPSSFASTWICRSTRRPRRSARAPAPSER